MNGTYFLIFAMGALLGLVLGAALCVRYVRQELTASITPRLDVIEFRLGTVQWHVNELVGATMHDQMLSQAGTQPPRHRPDRCEQHSG